MDEAALTVFLSQLEVSAAIPEAPDGTLSRDANTSLSLALTAFATRHRPHQVQLFFEMTAMMKSRRSNNISVGLCWTALRYGFTNGG